MEVKRVEHGGVEYALVVALRERVLRIPLGLTFSERELDAERDQIHFSLYQNGALVACLAVVRVDEKTRKIRQMAVCLDRQRKGFGQTLLKCVTEILKVEGVNRLSLHAREEAVSFYEKQGFRLASESFKEVGIPHYQMVKNI